MEFSCIELVIQWTNLGGLVGAKIRASDKDLPVLDACCATGVSRCLIYRPQCLADQLTLFQPGRADYPHLLLLAPPFFLN